MGIVNIDACGAAVGFWCSCASYSLRLRQGNPWQ